MTAWLHEPDQEGPVIGALDAQLDLRRWWRSPFGRQFGLNFGTSVASQMLLAAFDPDQEGLTPEALQQVANRPETRITIGHAMMAREIAQHEVDTLGRAATYWVSGEMVEEIGEAAASMPDGLVVEAQMLPASHGFAVLAEPLNVTDKNGLDFAVPAFSWGSDQGAGGVDFCSYSDPSDDRDPHRDEMAQWPQTHPLMLLHVDGLQFDTTIGDHFRGARIGDTNDDEAPLFMDAVGLNPVAVESARFTVKWLCAFWHLVGQRLPVFHRVPIRQQRRLAQRTLPDHPDECSIRVVDLRVYDYPDDDDREERDEPFQYSHRFRVRGHWRTLHRGTPQERPVWVEGYVKGDPSLPLIERDYVFRVRR